MKNGMMAQAQSVPICMAETIMLDVVMLIRVWHDPRPGFHVAANGRQSRATKMRARMVMRTLRSLLTNRANSV